PLTITRDAVDLIKHASVSVVERPDTLLVVSFAQLQKLFQLVYFPKVLTFSMQLTSLVEAAHKFTISYPISIAVLHQGGLIVANDVNVGTSAGNTPVLGGGLGADARAVGYRMGTPSKTLEAVTASLL